MVTALLKDLCLFCFQFLPFFCEEEDSILVSKVFFYTLELLQSDICISLKKTTSILKMI